MSQPTSSPSNPRARKLLVDLSIMTVIGVILALIGPFGSFGSPLALRLVTWLAFCYLGYAIYSPMGVLVDRAETALDLPRTGLWIVAVLAATIPMTVAVWCIGYLPRPVPLPTPQQALTSYLYVLVIGGGVTALFQVLAAGQAGRRPIEQQHHTAGSAPALPRFFERLPKPLGTELIALEMEDHYVRAHTAAGSDLILLRMRDAVAELDELEGEQVHRSWWVARSSVIGSRKDGRNIRLQLVSGLEAPVSRSAAPRLKELGWY